MKQVKEGFASQIGFILAAAGSSVGLGNIWRFPSLAAEYGGGVFLLMYVALAVTFGFTLTLTDLAIGRKTGSSVFEAYRKIDRRFSFMGWIAIIIPGIMLSYYCDIGGWIIKYAMVFITGSGVEAANDVISPGAGGEQSYFDRFVADSGEVGLFFLIFLCMTAAVIMLGVERGIEKASKIMMPVLLILMAVMAVNMMFHESSEEGVKFYILPDFSHFSIWRLLETFEAAFGQLFYSIGIAVGTLLTYGAYMKKSDSLEGSVRKIEIIDTAVAFLAGLIIIPAVFAYSSNEEAALEAGPGLLFETMPKVFASLPGGQIMGVVFFILVFFAALTSSFAIMEAVIFAVMERFNLSRKMSCLIVFISMIPLGMLSVLGHGFWSEITLFGMQFMDFFDFIISSVLMPVLALLTCILIGYFAGVAEIEEEVLISEDSFKMKRVYTFMVKYLCPASLGLMILLVFIRLSGV